MKGFTVDPSKCQRDGLCVADCPAGVIKKQSADDYPERTTESSCLILPIHKE
jgi:ferredoxin